MSKDVTNLKEINAYKKKINWGDVPSIYHMLSSSIGELDGIISHGFTSAFKDLLNKNNWNLQLLDGKIDPNGAITTNIKPKIALKHHFVESHYELHCFPIVNGEKSHVDLVKNPDSPFIIWYPNVSKKLFRINSLIPFISYSFKKGDEADMMLLRFSYQRVEELINILRESFDIIEIKGYSIAQFCRELNIRKELHDNESNSSSDSQHATFIDELINTQN